MIQIALQIGWVLYGCHDGFSSGMSGSSRHFAAVLVLVYSIVYQIAAASAESGSTSHMIS